jgi:hypothetical protein
MARRTVSVRSEDANGRYETIAELLRAELERAPAAERDVLRARVQATLDASHTGAPPAAVDRRSARLSVPGLVLLGALGGALLAPVVPPVGVVLLLMSFLLGVGALVVGGGRLVADGFVRVTQGRGRRSETER